jgi:hypothetical protein
MNLCNKCNTCNTCNNGNTVILVIHVILCNICNTKSFYHQQFIVCNDVAYILFYIINDFYQKNCTVRAILYLNMKSKFPFTS